jgi:hypothetical protein
MPCARAQLGLLPTVTRVFLQSEVVVHLITKATGAPSFRVSRRTEPIRLLCGTKTAVLQNHILKEVAGYLLS